MFFEADIIFITFRACLNFPQKIQTGSESFKIFRLFLGINPNIYKKNNQMGCMFALYQGVSIYLCVQSAYMHPL